MYRVYRICRVHRETAVKHPVRAARRDLAGHILRGAAPLRGRAPYRPRERSLSRLVGQPAKDATARGQLQGKCGTTVPDIVRARSELKQLAEGASGWTASCTKALLLWRHGPDFRTPSPSCRPRRSHPASKTCLEAAKAWLVPARCAVRHFPAGTPPKPALPGNGRRYATGQLASETPDISGGVLIHPSQPNPAQDPTPGLRVCRVGRSYLPAFQPPAVALAGSSGLL